MIAMQRKAAEAPSIKRRFRKLGRDLLGGENPTVSKIKTGAHASRVGKGKSQGFDGSVPWRRNGRGRNQMKSV